jgi:glycerophosphoryl diester phosphodiesterase
MKLIKSFIKYLSGIFLFFALSGILTISPVLVFNYSTTKDMAYTKVAHRGAAALAPENTLAAVNIGLSHNPDRIEIDVQQTKDGHVVVLHDITLDRTTNGSGLVKDFSLAAIKELSAGGWYAPEFEQEKVPLLQEVLRTIDGQSTLIIEIKKGGYFYPGIEEEIVKIIDEYDAKEWCIIHSFSTQVLQKIHELDPEIKVHKLFTAMLRFTPLMKADSWELFRFQDFPYIEEYSIHYRFANKNIISKIHAMGKKVNVWTVNDKDLIEELLALGVDGIITDHPDWLK